MSRLGIDIDPAAIIRNIFAEDIPDPAHLSVLGEMGGAESVICCFNFPETCSNISGSILPSRDCHVFAICST